MQRFAIATPQDVCISSDGEVEAHYVACASDPEMAHDLVEAMAEHFGTPPTAVTGHRSTGRSWTGWKSKTNPNPTIWEEKRAARVRQTEKAPMN